jgi:uncharacterized protein with HEPN domain
MTAGQVAKHLWDARRAADRIARFTAGRTFRDYLADEMLRAAVERQFEIIGEALAGLRRVDPARAATITDLPRIVAFRNILIHAYATMDDRLVWEVIEHDLAGLRESLARLLSEAEGKEPQTKGCSARPRSGLCSARSDLAMREAMAGRAQELQVGNLCDSRAAQSEGVHVVNIEQEPWIYRQIADSVGGVEFA